SAAEAPHHPGPPLPPHSRPPRERRETDLICFLKAPPLPAVGVRWERRGWGGEGPGGAATDSIQDVLGSGIESGAPISRRLPSNSLSNSAKYAWLPHRSADRRSTKPPSSSSSRWKTSPSAARSVFRRFFRRGRKRPKRAAACTSRERDRRKSRIRVWWTALSSICARALSAAARMSLARSSGVDDGGKGAAPIRRE